MKNETLKEIQDEDLGIIKLHELLEKVNVEHLLYDCYYDNLQIGYKIIIFEDNKQISLFQNDSIQGIGRKIIEISNFEDEPIQLTYLSAFTLIVNKQLNWFIKKQNEIINSFDFENKIKEQGDKEDEK